MMTSSANKLTLRDLPDAQCVATSMITHANVTRAADQNPMSTNHTIWRT